MSNFITNYHWRTKDLSKWAKDWFEEQLVSVSDVPGLKIDAPITVEGDCELGMRKAKLITIYDLRLTVRWSSEEETKGTFTIPEVSHDMELNDYIFESVLDSGGKLEIEQKAKKELCDRMRNVFQAFPKAMVQEHGADFYKQNGVSPSGTPLPTTNNTSSSGPILQTKSAPTAAPVPNDDPSLKSKQAKTINTTSIRLDGQFMSSASDLFDVLTNESKIPMWSRNPAKMKPEAGAEMSLFGGNITGKVISVDQPKEFITTWRAPTWPAEHFGQLKTTLTEGSDSTKLELYLTGVPVGTEEETERNLDIFYLRSLKQIGLGTIL
ncbi:uncharacterized protein MELLADRAFT_44926 [Melampsora larici-populina 98AG31]|uniref:Activator of Hsp90 ATPase AHSA1-like N-terminal domain-containing protein n=1 Tax=Melampsora larici-populina (strain 98AG31 / pathotype 3-4-7) TaxID=747676 RepID=F4RZQ2_MELLP|nr:uncharacterized protein MELLADRAFT_44926 [Melampsora larici-populina 98AG31]EGG02040.1 hypothetical protein MELLADRAFT_44926 [Melampsora larici-populina 98AG31]